MLTHFGTYAPKRKDMRTVDRPPFGLRPPVGNRRSRVRCKQLHTQNRGCRDGEVVSLMAAFAKRLLTRGMGQ